MRRLLVPLAFALMLASMAPMALRAEPDPRVEQARESMADRDYTTAIRTLQQVLEGQPEDADFARYLLGVAQALSGDGAAAVATFQDFGTRHPGSPWSAKAAFRMADAFARQKKFAEAVRIYEPAVALLASPERRQEIADLYVRFADKAWREAETLAGAPNRTAEEQAKSQALYGKCATLLLKALDTGLAPDHAPAAQLRIARCSIATGQFAEAARRLAAERKQRPTGALADQIAYHLGLAHFLAGQFTDARRAFQDFLADFPQSTFAAQAAYRIGLTFGLPTPAGRGALELGVKAHRDFVARFPQDPLAHEADFQIPQAYMHLGLVDDAIRELIAFLGRYPSEARAAEAPLARNLLGAAYRMQRRFADAERVWQEFLKEHPTHKDWSAVQQQLLDLEYEVGGDHYAQKNYVEARQAWQRFLDAHPLDPRCPETLYALGQIEHDRKEWQAAIDAWLRLVSKYPGSDPASHAQFMIGLTREREMHRFPEAIEAYRACTWGSYAPQAQARIQEMEAKKLVVVTERAFRSNETPELKITTRNLETLTLRVYRIDLESYFRKMHTLGGIDALELSLIRPDSTQQVRIQGFEKHREIEWTLPLPMTGEGAWAINLGDESYEATTLVVVTDLGLVSKSTRKEVFVFAQDLLQGKPRSGARVLVSDGRKVLVEGVTGDDGVWRAEVEELARAGDVRVFGRAGASVASDQMPIGDLAVAGGLEPRGFVYTDRPGYRPGDTVHVRGILRRVEAGTYVFAEGEEWDVQMVAPTGEALRGSTVKLTSSGAFSLAHALDAATPVGTYRVLVSRKDGPSFAGTFDVQEYPLERIGLQVSLDRAVLYRGETLAGRIRATYFSGEPASGRRVRWQAGDAPVQEALTDARGEVRFEAPTRDLAESQPVLVQATMDEEGIAHAAMAFVSVTGFEASVETVRGVYLAGEPFEAAVRALDPAGKPVAVGDMALAVIRIDSTNGRPVEVEVRSLPAPIPSETGRTAVSISLDKGGRYLLRARGTDRFGHAVVAVREIYISGDEDTVKLRLLADHDEFKVGEEPKVRVLNRAARGLALVTYEGERIYRYEIVDLAQGESALSVRMTDELAPNFALAVSMMEGNRFHTAAKEFLVARGLTIKLTPARETAAPGEEVAVTVETTDPLGRPVSAEVSLAMVDEGLLAVAPDTLTSITDFFYGQRRSVQVATATSCIWRYDARTVAAVPELFEELRRIEELREREREFERLRDLARREVARAGGRGTHRNPDLAGFASNAAGQQTDAYDVNDLALAQQANIDDAQVFYLDQMQSDGTDVTYRSNRVQTRRQLTIEGRFVQLQDHALYPLGLDFPGPQIRLGENGRPGRFIAFGPGAGRVFAGPGPVAALLRAHFPDTGYWNPSIVTDANGKATVTLRLPDNTTHWRLTAYGASRETRVGKGTAALAARKDFFVDLKLPEVLVEGDRPRVQARVVNASDRAQSVELTLRAEIGTHAIERTAKAEVPARGSAEVEFALDVPDGAATGDAREARFLLAGIAGEAADRIARAVPVEPWGAEIRRGAGGIHSMDQVETLELPEQDYVRRSLRIVLGASADRTLLDLAGLDDDPALASCRAPLPRGSAASEGLTLLAVLDYLDAASTGGAGDRRRLEARLAALVERLAVTQNDDGGWSWTAEARNQKESEPHASAEAARFLSGLKRKGFPLPQRTLPAALGFLRTAMTKNLSEDSRAILLHTLAQEGQADFAFVNRLYRERNRLSTYSLARLALTFHRIGRPELAAEIAEVVEQRDPTAAIAHSVDRDAKVCLWIDDEVETLALALQALQAARPKSAKIGAWIDALLARRWGARWATAKGTAAAAAALARHLAGSAQVAQRYTLDIRVNDRSIRKLDVRGSAGTTVIDVPSEALTAGRNRIEFDLEGNGRYSYSAVLSGLTRGLDPEARNRFVSVHRQIDPAPLVLDGVEIARGYRVISGSHTTFANPVTQLPAGRFAAVTLRIDRLRTTEGYLVLEEFLPAGAAVLPGSVTGGFDALEIRNGRLVFYLGERRDRTTIQYRLAGSLPGDYRVRPARVWSLYRPERSSTGEESALTVLPRDGKSADPFRMTPDELYALGRGRFDKGEHDAARTLFDELLSQWNVNDATLREVARMRLLVAVADRSGGRRPDAETCKEIVRFSEILRERFPEVILPFDTTLHIGQSYAVLGEPERALQVFRALAETLFARDSVVGADLETQGEFLGSIDFLTQLHQRFPDLPTGETAHLSLAQWLYQQADRVRTVPELIEKKVKGEDLIRRARARLQEFLALYPENPSTDGAGFSLAVAYFDLGETERVLDLCERMGARHPRSSFLDNYLYLRGYAAFRLEKLDLALELCRRVAAEKFPGPSGDGVPVESENKGFATFIVGQVYESMGKPKEAIAEYEKVKDRLIDALDSIQHYTSKTLSLPEVTTFRVQEPVKVKIKYRNTPKVEIVAYAVDLMKLYLIRKNLDRIAGIQLAGIDPLFRREVELGPGLEITEVEKEIDLPITQTGAYLIVAKGPEGDASGMVLVSALASQVEVDAESGRVRVNVQEVPSGKPAVRAHVKVVGEADGRIRSGYTDLRGVFVCDDVRGRATVIVSKENEYAFHRGRTPLQVAQNKFKSGQAGQAGSVDLFSNVRGDNDAWNGMNRQKLQKIQEAQKNQGEAGCAVDNWK